MMKVLFTSWDNDGHFQEELDHVPRVGEYMRFHLKGETSWMRVSYVAYEHFSINPRTLSAHVYLEEVVGDPPFIKRAETLEEKVEREADEKYRDEHGLNFDGSPIVYPGEEEKEEAS